MRRLLPLALLSALPLTACVIHIDGKGWTGGASSYSYGKNGDRGPRRVGNGEEATQTRPVDAFDAVHLYGFFDVHVSVGGDHAVLVRGDSNLVDHLTAVVNGGALELSMEEGRYEPDQDLVVEVTLPDLRAAGLSGSGDLTIVGLRRDAVALSIAGSGDLTASGHVDSLTIECRGSGDADLAGLHAVEAAVVVSGSADVVVHADQRLDVSISGSGDVRYVGRPSVSARISGSGDVSPR